MSTTLHHPSGDAVLKPRPPGRWAVEIVRVSAGSSVPSDSGYVTAYPPALIDAFLQTKGIGAFIDEIRREEDLQYTQTCLENDLLGYVPAQLFGSRRILDFGCGAGASTVILARMFPDSEIVGVELVESLLRLAQLRATHYRCQNVEFRLSPAQNRLPVNPGSFDYVVCSAVFEHLLPAERPVILSQIWSALRPNGVLFIDQTPYRWFPFEGHTTRLPLINYLPDRAALYAARRFSHRVAHDESWDHLLRRGIRGTTVGQISGLLTAADDAFLPELLTPCERGFRDRIDLWEAGYAVSILRKYPQVRPIQRVLKYMTKAIYRLTGGAVFLPTLSLAFRKKVVDAP